MDIRDELNAENVDEVEALRALPDSCIPMTVTSPPYDEMRDDCGHVWDLAKFRSIADELCRVTKPGGTVVWVVRDSIVDDGESGTSDEHKA